MGDTTPGPLPSKHIFLHEIAKQPTGSKLRFLGCVASYHITTGLLVLEHAFPSHAPRPPRVSVDMTLILESVKPEMLQSGTWLNVIGYSVNEPPLRRSRVLRSGSAGGDTDGGIVQAVLVWSAGALRIEEYERVLMQQHGAARELYTTP